METRNDQIKRLYSRMLGVAMGQSINFSDAEDVVHNTILELLKQPEDKQTTDSWILRLTVSRVLNFIRDGYRRADRERGFLDETHGDGALNPEEELLHNERMQRLDAAVQALPSELADVFNAVYGLNNDEPVTLRVFSRDNHVAKSTAHDRLVRAITFVKEAI